MEKVSRLLSDEPRNLSKNLDLNTLVLILKYFCGNPEVFGQLSSVQRSHLVQVSLGVLTQGNRQKESLGDLRCLRGLAQEIINEEI